MDNTSDLDDWLVGWLGFTACQPIGLFYAEYVIIYELIIYKLTLFFMSNCLQTHVLIYLTHKWGP